MLFYYGHRIRSIVLFTIYLNSLRHIFGCRNFFLYQYSFLVDVNKLFVSFRSFFKVRFNGAVSIIVVTFTCICDNSFNISEEINSDNSVGDARNCRSFL